MQDLDMNLLTLIVGLSVYVSSIRFVVIGRLIATPAPSANQKASYKNFLLSLIPADALLVVSGTLLFLFLFWGHLIDPNGKAPGWFSPWVIGTFAGAAAYLVLHHVVSWCKTISA